MNNTLKVFLEEHAATMAAIEEAREMGDNSHFNWSDVRDHARDFAQGLTWEREEFEQDFSAWLHAEVGDCQ